MTKSFFRRLCWFGISLLVCGTVVVLPVGVSVAATKTPSDKEIDRAIKNQHNAAIIDRFLKFEMAEVDQYATKPLLQRHPTLIFFIKQNERGILKSLFFLEQQVHRLQDAQRNINRLPYSIAFSSSEKTKILGLRPTADRIISYGIPLIKRDFYRVLVAAREEADKRGKHPIELMASEEFRNAVYRRAEPDAAKLDAEMGELSEGELFCMQLGWVLETVTVTRLWLVFNDNKLPAQNDFMEYRKKRSEYWKKRLTRIYSGKTLPEAGSPSKSSGK